MYGVVCTIYLFELSSQIFGQNRGWMDDRDQSASRKITIARARNESYLAQYTPANHSGKPRIFASVPPRISLCVRTGTSQASNMARY